jgi:hypothetical protein
VRNSAPIDAVSCSIAESNRTEDLKHKAADRYARLEQSRKVGPFVDIGKRFFEIDGLTYGGLLAIELFTTVLPLVIIGYSYMSGFADNASLGIVLVRQLGLDSEGAQVVRAAFGASSGLKSTWTFVGVLGFVLWGIPMSITVAAMYAKAWRREQFSIGTRIWRGMVWFLLYLAMLIVRERIHSAPHVDVYTRVPFFVLSLVPTWVFWSLSPVLLVRDGARGRRFLIWAGLAGVIIEGVIMRIAVRIVFPMLLSGWAQFGPIGVSMTLMTWAGVVGVAWVLTACAGAIAWERSAPPTTVVDAQTSVPEAPISQT